MRRETLFFPFPPAGEGSIANALRTAASRLEAALQLERHEARLEARLLAGHALGVDHAWLIAHDRDDLEATPLRTLEALIARRESGEPIAYILGEKEFYGRLFRVSPDVLIPRPETELLVEAALGQPGPEHPLQVLDLGTGSGCIAISLARARPHWRVTAVDASRAALGVAQDNARRLGAHVEFLVSDWFSALPGRRFDLIVANPPYVAEGDRHLQQGGLPHEPRAALVSGIDGLDAIRHLVAAAPDHLSPRGVLMVEHGWDQGEPVHRLLTGGGYERVETLHDLAGRARCSLGSKAPETGPALA